GASPPPPIDAQSAAGSAGGAEEVPPSPHAAWVGDACAIWSHPPPAGAGSDGGRSSNPAEEGIGSSSGTLEGGRCHIAVPPCSNGIVSPKPCDNGASESRRRSTGPSPITSPG